MIGIISFVSGVFIGCVIMYILVTRGAVYGDYNITFKEKTDDGNQEGMEELCEITNRMKQKSLKCEEAKRA